MKSQKETGDPQSLRSKEALGGRARAYEFDAIRFVATLFVVAVHSLVVIGPQAGGAALWYRLSAQTLFFTGNALFFLMSGHFNLRPPREGDSIWKFYSSKLRNIVLPTLLVFLGRSLLDWHAGDGSTSFVRLFAHNLLSAQGYVSIEYWFIYALFGYLLVSPFVRRIFPGLSPTERRTFLALGLAYQTYATIFANLGREVVFSLPISGFFFVYCLGSFIDEGLATDVPRLWLAPLTVICLALSVLLIHQGYGQHAQDTSPLFIIATLGLYADLIRIFRNKRTNAFVSLVARHSFSVYLVHMIVLVPLSQLPELQGLTGLWAIAGSMFLTLAVFGISLGLAITLDMTLMKAAKAAYDFAFARR